MTVEDHFQLVASVDDSLRTTDQAPVRRIGELLPGGSLLAASDVAEAMLAELQAGCAGRTSVVALRCTAEELPIRTGCLDLVMAFNKVGRFLAEAARVLGAGGRLFLYTRTLAQNARRMWGRWLPGFVEREQRLYSETTLTNGVHHTRGLRLVVTQSLSHARSSTPERLRAQVEGRHYSTFSLYEPDELGQARAGRRTEPSRARVEVEEGPR